MKQKMLLLLKEDFPNRRIQDALIYLADGWRSAEILRAPGTDG